MRSDGYYCTECKSQIWIEGNYDGYCGRCQCMLKYYYFTVGSSEMPHSWKRGEKIDNGKDYDKI